MLFAELVGNGEDVGSEFGERVRSCAARLAAFVVAALVGNDNAEAARGERVDLLVPGIPGFWEAVQEDDDRTVRRAGDDGVEFDRTVVKCYVFEWARHRCRVYP